MNPTEPPTPAPTKAELEAMHGTPAEFADACRIAEELCIVTAQESNAAIAKYEREWSAAK